MTKAVPYLSHNLWMFELLISVSQLLTARRSFFVHRIDIKRFRVRVAVLSHGADYVLRLQIAWVITYQRDLNLSRAPLTRLTIRYQWKCNERAWRLACNAMHFHHSHYEWRSFTPLRAASMFIFCMADCYVQCSLSRNVYVTFTRMNKRDLQFDCILYITRHVGYALRIWTIVN